MQRPFPQMSLHSQIPKITTWTYIWGDHYPPSQETLPWELQKFTLCTNKVMPWVLRLWPISEHHKTSFYHPETCHHRKAEALPWQFQTLKLLSFCIVCKELIALPSPETHESNRWAVSGGKLLLRVGTSLSSSKQSLWHPLDFLEWPLSIVRSKLKLKIRHIW